MARFKPFLRAAALALAVLSLPAAAASLRLDPVQAEARPGGPGAAKGAVIWSHGRSLDRADADAPSPPYLEILAEAGWDVFRFNRSYAEDTLPASSRALARHAEALKQRGYRQVVLAGQSFGAFLAIMAAGKSGHVDAVVGTAPAAFGNYTDSYETWRLNASQLYLALREIRRADVMLFFFHGDDFDPGGRADQSREILTARGLEHLIVDQPADLPGHGAAATGLFVRRFGDCIARFIEPGRQEPVENCERAWGRVPSAQLPAPPIEAVPAGWTTSGPAGHPLSGRWYGFYLNGRELMLDIERIEGDRVTATYILGPGIDPDHVPERVRRQGRLVGEEIVFDEPGLNPLRFAPRPDGRLAGSWSTADGESRLNTILRRVY